MATPRAVSEVKGMYFVAARQYLLDAEGSPAVDRVVKLMPPTTADAMRDPEASRWYPEAALRDAFHAVHREVCRGDLARFHKMIEGSTSLGMQRFFRALLGISTPAFYLRNFPTVVGQLRRGPAKIEVDVSSSSRSARVRFVDMPFSDDTLYHAATVAGFDVVFAVMGHPRPHIQLTSATKSSYELSVEWT